jgi:peptide/nickel transport system permease protein
MNAGQALIHPTAAVHTVQAVERSPGYWARVFQRLLRDKLAIVAGCVVLLLLLLAFIGPWIAPQDPSQSSILSRLKPIGTEGYPLGTDELGRDMLSRLMAGAQLSLFMGLTPVFLAFVMGSLLGVFAGFVGGWANTAIMRTIDVFYAFPSVLLAIALSGALGAGISNALVSLTVVFIPPIVRVAESVTTQVRGRDYVEAARASGASALSIVRVHILGNVIGPIFVYATGLIAVSMILASGLSFLGLGVKPPVPEWGLMLNTLRTAIYSQPWVAALPGLMIFITSIAFNVLSDGLRNAMEVK